MCVGGMLAFDIALQLQKQGQQVAMVAIIDAADVEADKRTGYAANQRLSRFSEVMSGNDQIKQHERLFYILSQVTQKARNLVAYESQKQLKSLCDRTRLKQLRNRLDQGLPIPASLQGIPVRQVLLWAQQAYVPQAKFEGELLLFRATQKSSVFDGTLIDDTPYVELYSDPLLGWNNRATQAIQVHDISGGHSSMLQEPNVQILAEKIQTYIDTSIDGRLEHDARLIQETA
jgi:thioesterase domain-containing protein